MVSRHEKEIRIKSTIKGAARTKRELKAIDKTLKKVAVSQEKLARSQKKAGLSSDFMRIKTSGLRRELGAIRNQLLVYAFAFGGVAAALKKTIKLFIAQEAAERSLEVALGRNIDSLKIYASHLQQISMYGDEVILSAMTMIAAFVKDEEALKKATKATMDLAAAKGFDLKQAADLVGKTLGSTTNALTRYGIVVTGAVGSTERLETLTRNVDKAFGGMARGMIDTTEGAIAQMTNAIGDLSEAIGEGFSPSIIQASKDIKLFAEAVEIALRASVIEKGKNLLDELAESFIKIRNNILLGIAPLRLLRMAMGFASEGMEEFREKSEEVIQATILEEWAGKMEEVAYRTEEFIEYLKIEVEEIDILFDKLLPSQQLLVKGIEQLTDGLIQATLYGQKFGDSIVASLKAIAAQLIKSAAIYMLMNLFTGGAASFTGFAMFATTGKVPFPQLPNPVSKQAPLTVQPASVSASMQPQNVYYIETWVGGIDDETSRKIQEGQIRIAANA